MPVKVKRCGKCAHEKIHHEYQDKEYGEYVRIQNPCDKKEGVYRCTVCGAENNLK